MTEFLKSANPVEKELFARISQLLTGASYDMVNNVALNLVINSVCQTQKDRRSAEAKINELFARTKSVLLDQFYDAVTGKPRGIVTHVIEPPFHVEADTFFKN